MGEKFPISGGLHLLARDMELRLIEDSDGLTALLKRTTGFFNNEFNSLRDLTDYVFPASERRIPYWKYQAFEGSDAHIGIAYIMLDNNEEHGLIDTSNRRIYVRFYPDKKRGILEVHRTEKSLETYPLAEGISEFIRQWGVHG